MLITFSDLLVSLISFTVENSVLLRLVLGGVAGVAQFITSREQTQLNRVYCFRLLVFSLHPENQTFRTYS